MKNWLRRIALLMILPPLITGCFGEEELAEFSYRGTQLDSILYAHSTSMGSLTIDGYGTMQMVPESEVSATQIPLNINVHVSGLETMAFDLSVGEGFPGEITLTNNQGSVIHSYYSEDLPVQLEMEVWEMQNALLKCLVVDFKLINTTREELQVIVEWEAISKDTVWKRSPDDLIVPLSGNGSSFSENSPSATEHHLTWRVKGNLDPSSSEDFTFLMLPSQLENLQEAAMLIDGERRSMHDRSEAVLASTVPLPFLELVTGNAFPPEFQMDALLKEINSRDGGDPSLLLLLLEHTTASISPSWVEINWPTIKTLLDDMYRACSSGNQDSLDTKDLTVVKKALYRSLFQQASGIAIRMNDPQRSMRYFELAKELEQQLKKENPENRLFATDSIAWDEMPFLLPFVKVENAIHIIDSIILAVNEASINPLQPGKGQPHFETILWEFYGIYSGFQFDGVTHELRFEPLEDVLPMRFAWYTPDGYGTIRASRAGFYLECLGGQITLDQIAMKGRSFFVMREFIPSHKVDVSYDKEVLTLHLAQPLTLQKGDRFKFELP